MIPAAALVAFTTLIVFIKRAELSALWNGWRDGRKGIPLGDSAYERRLISKVEEKKAKIVRRWLESLESKRRREEKRRQDEERARRQNEEFERQRDRLEGQIKKLDDASKYYEKELQDVQDELDKLEPSLSRGKFLLFLIGLSLGDFILNVLVFEVFGFGRVLTYLGALSVIAFINVFCYFTAMRWKEERGDLMKAIVSPLFFLLVGVFLGVSYLRVKYLWEVQEYLPQMSQLWVATIYFLINVSVSIANILVWYERCPFDSRTYHYLSRKVKRLKSKFDEIDSSLRKKKAAYQSLSGKVAQLPTDPDPVVLFPVNLYSLELKAGMEEIAKLKAKMMEVEQKCRALIYLYQMANIRARREDDQFPKEPSFQPLFQPLNLEEGK